MDEIQFRVWIPSTNISVQKLKANSGPTEKMLQDDNVDFKFLFTFYELFER